MTKYNISFINELGNNEFIETITTHDNLTAADYLKSLEQHGDDRFDDLNGCHLIIEPVYDELVILMNGHNTRFDAEMHIKNGATLYESIEDFRADYPEITDEQINDLMSGKRVADFCEYIKYAGKDYWVTYCL